jgi:hypothetical protein
VQLRPREARQAGGEEFALPLLARRDEAAPVTAARRAHEPLAAQGIERLAHGRHRDPELAGQLGLPGQALAVPDESEHDGLAHPLFDLLAAPGTGERGEDGRACLCGEAERTRHLASLAALRR